MVLNAQGNPVSETRHYPYGEERWHTSTLPTDYRFAGQRLEQSLGLYHMGARWYDPYINRWLSADTLVPEPANPQSFNRYSYVRNNPLKFIDPSGFCEGTAEDHNASQDACWNWIEQIQTTYSNIWVDPVIWTADELAMVYYMLEQHVFRPEILAAEKINLHRLHGGDLGPAGQWGYVNGSHEVTIFDRAYFFTPSANEVETKSSNLNFQGTLIHEFTHVATRENPEILESYRDADHFTLSQPVGGAYGWAACGTNRFCITSERVAMTTSAYQLTPDVFRWSILSLLKGTYWQKNWIEQLDTPPGPGEISIHAP